MIIIWEKKYRNRSDKWFETRYRSITNNQNIIWNKLPSKQKKKTKKKKKKKKKKKNQLPSEWYPKDSVVISVGCLAYLNIRKSYLSQNNILYIS